MLRALLVFVLGSAIVFMVVAFATVTSSEDDKHACVDVDVSLILDLANSAEADAERMDSHATTMLNAAASRPDLFAWIGEAQTTRANAQSLRFLAGSARAVHHDMQTFPITSSAVDLGRLLGNGRNLQSFGKSIVAHAEAMDTHVTSMRRQAGEDRALIAAIEILSGDVSALRSDGQSAVHQGEELANRALTLARSIGVELE